MEPDPAAREPAAIRLSRYLSLCGVASRRKAMERIRLGRVSVNGSAVHEPATPVVPERDRVAVDGREVRAPRDWILLAFHKPRGYITSRADAARRPTIMDLLGDAGRAVFPVGRLDRDSEGLLLLTNHGELANALLHPRYGIEKVYVAALEKRPSERVLRRLRRGVLIGPGEWARASAIERLREGNVLRIVMTEGKKREVRRMLRASGHRVLRLVREAFAGIALGDLPPGRTRPLTTRERAHLEELTGLDLRPPAWVRAGPARKVKGGRRP